MGKPPDYDPRMDASVRVQIGKLRQRLERYYASEAPGAGCRLTLPKGHFELVLDSVSAEGQIAISEESDGINWRAVALTLAGVSVVLVVAVGVLVWKSRAAAPAGVAASAVRWSSV